jgi:hypothetical protein
MTDVVFATKSRNSNLAMALSATAVKDEASGLYYYASARTAADVMELTDDELSRLYQISMLGTDSRYVVLDVPFAWSGSHAEALSRSALVVAVTDGRPLSNHKLMRAVEALELRTESGSTDLSWRPHLVFYNQFSSNGSVKIDSPDLPEAGGAGRLVGLTESQVVEQLEQSAAFNLLINRVALNV